VSKRARLKIGVIGAGMIGDVHIDCIRRDGRAEVSWIATRSADSLRQKLTRHAIANGTRDYRRLLADRQVAAVIIASPPATHFGMAIDALRAGKHVLLEKPMVRTRAELARLLSEVARHPRQVVLECSCRHARLTPKFPFVKQIVDGGEIGDVYHVHHNHLTRSTFIEYNPRGAWAHSRKQGGGPVFDWGVYDLSFHLGVLGDRAQLARVRSFERGGLKAFRDQTFVSDVEEHAAAYLEFKDGLTYYYERGAGVHMEAANETRLYGTKGALRLAYCSWDAPEVEVFSVDGRGREKRQTRRVSMRAHIDDNLALTRHFLDCVLDGARPSMPPALAAKHLEIIFRIQESASRR